jgi:hypothetical protein
MHSTTELCCNGKIIELTRHLYAGRHPCHRVWKQRQHHQPWQVPQGEESQCKGEDHFISVMLRCKLDDPVMGLM